MTSQPLDSVLQDAFLTPAALALQTEGFVADEHEFAPYRETVSEYYLEIQKALASRGVELSLEPGFLKHPQAGFAYFVFNTACFATHAEAERAVSAWLTDKYGSEE